MNRDPGQVTCGTHSHGREVPAWSHIQPGADTSQPRWRDPRATKKPAVVSPAHSVFLSTRLFANIAILKVGSFLFSIFPYKCSPPVHGHKQHTQTPCSPGSQSAPHLCEPSAAHGWSGKVWHAKNQPLLSLSLLATKTTSRFRLSTFRKFSPKLKTPLRDFPDSSKLLETATPPPRSSVSYLRVSSSGFILKILRAQNKSCLKVS